jgi:hypothetical protein
MASPANIAKHPLHPILVLLPIGLWIFSLMSDLVYAFEWGRRDLERRCLVHYGRWYGGSLPGCGSGFDGRRESRRERRCASCEACRLR